MSRFNCPECGKEFSGKLDTCPHCAASITICPKCNNEVSSIYKRCPNCFSDFDTSVLIANEAHEDLRHDSANAESASTTWVTGTNIAKSIKMVALVLAVLSIIGGIVLMAEFEIIGLVSMIASLVSCLLMYAVGEIISQLVKLNESAKLNLEILREQKQ
jgi:uncharacterized protein (UPF0212 family)